MSTMTLVLGLHVVAGTIGLLLAGPVVLTPKRRGPHTVLGRLYVGALAVMCATAVLLGLADPARLAGLLGIAVGTAAAGAVGLAVARWRHRFRRLPGGWLVWHLNAMGSSVIAFVTAFAVQMTGGHVLAWIVPTLVGSPLIARHTAALTRAGRSARRHPGRLDPGARPAPAQDSTSLVVNRL